MKDSPFFPEEDVNLVLNGQSVFTGSLLLADISGFTEITEALTRGGKKGVEELSSLLNRCFDAMIGAVHANGGTVLYFSGDSILARFGSGDAGESCGGQMLAAMEDFRRVVILGERFSIRVKAVSGKGSWNQFILGSPARAHMVVTGGVVRELAAREDTASPGELIVLESSVEPLSEMTEPPEVTPESFLSPGSERLHGEYRPVTPVFVTASCPSDQWSVRGFQDLVVRVQDIIEEHGGYLHHIDDLVAGGTRLMALFGAPVSHGRDTVSAVEAALAISGDTYAPFHVSCGIDTGFVFAGMTGNEERKRYTVIGDPVNTAARLSETASETGVTVSEAVARASSREIVYESPAVVTLKGKSSVQRAFPAVGVVPGGTDGTFVGRESELARLLELARIGGDPVLLHGGAGVGKSTLTHRFADEISPEFPRLLKGFAGERRSGSSIMGSLLMNACGIEPGMAPEEKRRRLGELIDRTGDKQLKRREPFLAGMLLRLEVDDPGFLRVPPKLRRENLADALVLLLSMRGTLVIIEDTHRAGEEELELLMEVITGVRQRSEVFFLLTSRPEGEPMIPEETVPGRISLEGLSDDESDALLSSHSEGLPLDESIASLLKEKSHGNPFFLVQFLMYLRDRNLIKEENGMWISCGDAGLEQLPESVFSMIMARIDTLAERTRESLKVASVVGMRFSEPLLSSVVNRSVHAELSESMKAGLTFVNSYAELEHIFSHMLIRDVAYDSLLSERRRELHREIGEHLERMNTGGGSEPFLAEHFLKGEVWEKAVEYSIKAGELASEEYRNGQALDHFRTAESVLEEHMVEKKETLARCCLLCGNVLDRVGSYEPALEYYGKTVAASRTPELTLKALLSMADIIFNQGNLDESMELITEVEALAEQSEDDHMDIRTHAEAFKAWTCCIKGEIQRAEKHALKAVEIGESLSGYTGYEKARKLGHALNTLATVHWAKSELDSARELYEKAIELALENGLKREAAVTWGNIGLTLEKQGRYQEAVESIEKQLRTSTEIGEKLLILSAHGDLGMTYAMMGDFTRALEHTTRQLELSTAMKVGHDRHLALNHMAELHITCGRLEEAEAFLVQAGELLKEKYMERAEAHTLFTSARLASEKGESEKALELYERSLEISRKVQSLSFQHRILMEKGTILLDNGRVEEARQAAVESAEIADKTGMETAEAGTDSLQGRVSCAEGYLQEGLRKLRRACDTYRRLGTRFHLAVNLRWLGEILGEEEDGPLRLEEARRLFREMGLEFRPRMLP